MTHERRGVTRGYVGGLLLATLVVASALVVASWGFIALLGDREPVETDGIAKWVAPLGVFVALGALAWGLWQQAIILLRGHRSLSWAHMVVLAGAAYLLWCIVGTLAGLSIDETWLSPFSIVLAPIWAIASLLFWAILLRRVYTDRDVPKWPWEKREEDERNSGGGE